MLLQEIKTTNLGKNKKHLFVVPMGATEQHGPFLPLGTDTYIQQTIIDNVSPELPDVYFLPTLPITCSQEHEGFPGTVWLSKTTLLAVIADICDSLQPYAHTIAFVSWHGGNLSIIDQFITQYSDQIRTTTLTHIKLDTPEITKKIEELLGGVIDEHAGNSEISMMLAIEESLVTTPTKHYPKKIIQDAWTKKRLARVSQDGIVDNHPRWVINKEHGKIIIKIICKNLKEVLENLSKKM